MNYVIFLGICQSLIALLLLPASRAKRPANEWLRWLLACICMHLTLKFIIFTCVPHPEIRRGFNTFVGLAYGPLLWIFAQKLRNDRYRPFRHWYVFLPAIGSAFFYLFIAIYTGIHGQEPLALMHGYNTATLYASIGLVIFPILTLRIARGLAPFWNIECHLLRQLAVILIALCGLAVFGACMPYLKGLNVDQTSLAIRIIAYAGLLVGCVLIIQYEHRLQRMLGQSTPAAEAAFETETASLEAASMALQRTPVLPRQLTMPVAAEASTDSYTSPVISAEGAHPMAAAFAAFTVPVTDDVEIALAQPIPAEDITEEELPTRKPLLDEAQQQLLKNRLTRLMEKEKVFTDPELSLEKLAALLQVPRNQASELMNQGVGKSFYQYINEYRIREVVTLLDKCTRHGVLPNILSLAFEAGFHSKSSFNLYFKKVTGYTPSAYLKRDRATTALPQTGYC